MTTSLSESYLCLDCETVSSNSRNCAKCQSGALLNLASILNRSEFNLSAEVACVMNAVECLMQEVIA